MTDDQPVTGTVHPGNYLRETARMMRQMAAHTSPAPWRALAPPGERPTDEWSVMYDSSWNVMSADPGAENRWFGLFGPTNCQDATYVAAWDPGVTALVATLLERVAGSDSWPLLSDAATMARAWRESLAVSDPVPGEWAEQ